MNKTLAALDDLTVSFIGLLPAWLDMLKSTRFLTLIATGAAIFLQYKLTGGFTTWESLGLAALTSATGVSFMGFKTARPSVLTTAIEPTAAAAPIPAAIPAQPSFVQLTPFDSKVLTEYVETNVLSSYGAATMAAKYYTAMNWLNYQVKFNNGAAYLEAIDYIEANYALPAFKEIWGKTYDDAVNASEQAIIDNKPCTLKGMDTIAAYMGGGRKEILISLRDLRGLRGQVEYRLNVDGMKLLKAG